jgi:molybdenum cofactor biosynthesis protein B
MTMAERADAVVTSGGTGIAGRDATVQAADVLIEKPIPGFGELFRMLSWDEVGAAAMLSRATAGVYALDRGGVLLFCLPGSTNAVRLGLERLILPELRHLVWELRRQG